MPLESKFYVKMSISQTVEITRYEPAKETFLPIVCAVVEVGGYNLDFIFTIGLSETKNLNVCRVPPPTPLLVLTRKHQIFPIFLPTFATSATSLPFFVLILSLPPFHLPPGKLGDSLPAC